MKIEQSNQIRGRAWCRQFYEDAIADIMDKIEDIAEIIENIKYKADQFDLESKNPAAYEEMIKKAGGLDEELEKFAAAIFCK